jgi:PAS domain S-box-containing protein
MNPYPVAMDPTIETRKSSEKVETRAARDVFRGDGEVGALCRALDWSATPLGPVETWPEALRTSASLVLAAPMPMIVLAGPELVQIYNDGYRRLMGRKHPSGLGQPTHRCWPEAREFTDPVYTAVLERGESVSFQDQQLVLDRDGSPQDVYFDLGYSPVRGPGGRVEGVLAVVLETTERVLGRQAREQRARLDAELEDERARSALALRAGRLGDWELDLRSRDSPRRSPRHDEIFGYTLPRADWSFEIFLEHVHAADREHVVAAFGEAMERGTPWDFECRIIRRDGELRWIWARGETNHDSAGVPVRMLGIVADITERKRSEQALQRYADQLRGLAAAGLAINARRDVREMLETISAHARALIGAHVAATTLTDGGQGAGEIAATERSGEYRKRWGDATDPCRPIVRALVEGEQRPVRLTRRDLAAHPAWSDAPASDPAALPARGCLAVPLVARDGATVGLIHLTDRLDGDFTEADEAILVQLAQIAAIAVENARLFHDAEEANRAKSEFLAAMSHDLRTPLNAVGGYVELLGLGIHGPLSDAQREALDRIAANQRHLLTLINDILSFARLEAGRLEFELEPLAAADVLSSLEALVAPQAEARGVAYSIERCDPGIRVHADPERIRQILLNLVGNAIKFTPGGWVTVESAAEGPWVEFRVRDNGRGIPAEEMERIFDPFQQVGRRLNQPQEGVGLGLAISRDLARAMNGDLTAESTPGEGSTFTVRLPCAPAA